MKRLLALFLAFAVNAYGATAIPNIFATQPSGNVPASYLDTDFALISNYNTFSNYLVDSGAANAYVVTFPAGTTGSLAAGLLINFKAGADNTGASTLAANGMTAKNITNYDATALAAGQIKAGAIVSVIYDGTQFKLAGQPGGVSLVAITDDTTTNATMYPAWVTADTGNLPLKTSHSTLTWNPSTGSLGATTFVGALTGNVTGNVSGTAATVTGAAQAAITSVGTLTSVTSSGAISGTTVYASTEYKLQLDGSDSIQGGFQGTNVANSRAFNLQLNAAGTTMDFWKYSGAAWVNVMQMSTAGLAVTGTTSSTSFADSGSNLIISSTAPTIASGFGTSPSIVANNTAAFQVTVGSGGTASSGVITMPTPPNGWACSANMSAGSLGVGYIVQIYVTSPTSLTVYNVHTTTGAAVAWSAGTPIQFQCAAF